MSEADLVAADDLATPLASQTSTLPLLLHRGRPGLIVLARKPGDNGKALAQRFYPIEQLIGELPGAARAATGTSLATLSGGAAANAAPGRPARVLPRSRLLQVGSLVRLRTGRHLDGGAGRAGEVRAAAAAGGGFHRSRPAGRLVPRRSPVAALPRWRSVQRHLAGVLLTLGADRGALDACRILRLPGTTNSRSGLAAASCTSTSTR